MFVVCRVIDSLVEPVGPRSFVNYLEKTMSLRRAGRAVGVVFGGTTAVVGATGAAYAYVEPVRNRIPILFLLRTPSFPSSLH